MGLVRYDSSCDVYIILVGHDRSTRNIKTCGGQSVHILFPHFTFLLIQVIQDYCAYQCMREIIIIMIMAYHKWCREVLWGTSLQKHKSPQAK